MKQMLQQLDKKIDAMVDEAVTNALNNAIKKAFKPDREPNPLHEYVMGQPKRHARSGNSSDGLVKYYGWMKHHSWMPP